MVRVTSTVGDEDGESYGSNKSGSKGGCDEDVTVKLKSLVREKRSRIIVKKSPVVMMMRRVTATSDNNCDSDGVHQAKGYKIYSSSLMIFIVFLLYT